MRKSLSQSASFNPRVFVGLGFFAGVVVALLVLAAFSRASAQTEWLKERSGHDFKQGERPKSHFHTARLQVETPPPKLAEAVLLSQNFDGVTAPALPAGWAATNVSGSAPFWVTSTSGVPAPPADSIPNAAFIDDPNGISDKRLDSPGITVHSSAAQLTFRNNYNVENGFDGGVLEIKIGTGAFTDIIAAGGSFVAGGYSATIPTDFGSPIGGRQAWTGNSNGFITTTVNLPAAAANQSIVLRWREASDASVEGQGWRIDNVQVSEPPIAPAGSTIQSEGCLPFNGTIDPGETVTVSFCVQSSQNTTNLVGTLQATGGVTNPSGPQTYGALVGGGAAVCRSFSFRADPNGTCGGTLVATIQFQDGASDLGTAALNFTLGVPGGTIVSEGFNDITTLIGAGWSLQNNSQPIGSSGWFQGNTQVFTAQAGADSSYIGANFNNGMGVATISNWLLTPAITLQNGTQLFFWTRTVATPQFPDRLQVRMSLNGNSTNVGSTATSVGDFTTLLLDINPTYTTTGYPTTWTQFTVTLTGIPSPTTGRLALRYFVENAGPSGTHSDYIGIDTVSVTSPAACCLGSVPTPLSAASRKNHGLAGAFDINLPLSGTPGIECRSTGGTSDYTMVVSFGTSVTINGNPQAQVTTGTGTVGSGGVSNGGMVTVSGNNVTVPLTNVANAQTINVTLFGVTSGSGSGNVTIPMSILIGDTNGNAAVNSADVAQTKGRIGQVLATTNFRSDVNANGAINSADVSLIKLNVGTGLP